MALHDVERSKLLRTATQKPSNSSPCCTRCSTTTEESTHIFVGFLTLLFLFLWVSSMCQPHRLTARWMLRSWSAAQFHVQWTMGDQRNHVSTAESLHEQSKSPTCPIICPFRHREEVVVCLRAAPTDGSANGILTSFVSTLMGIETIRLPRHDGGNLSNNTSK